MCDATEKKHREYGIPEEITVATLKDIVNWAMIWSDLRGELCLFQTHWLSSHMKGRLFRLGRLQFCFGDYGAEDNGDLKSDDHIMEVHIPAGESMSNAACDESYAMAEEFFKKYFPDYVYKAYTCHSWLLDPTLSEFLPEESNIIRFGKRYKIARLDDSEAIFRYVFRWDTTRENLNDFPAKSSLAKAIKAEIEKGTLFHETLGYIPKNSL